MNLVRLAVLLTVLALLPTRALALEVRESVEVSVPPEKVWQLIGPFCSIQDWYPSAGHCKQSENNGAALRTLTTADGARVIDKRVQYSDEGMSYSYRMVDGPLPVADYEATLAVMDAQGGSVITWSGEFRARGTDDAAATNAIASLYRAGLAALKERLR
jgi:hypothetical protein